MERLAVLLGRVTFAPVSPDLPVAEIPGTGPSWSANTVQEAFAELDSFVREASYGLAWLDVRGIDRAGK